MSNDEGELDKMATWLKIATGCISVVVAGVPFARWLGALLESRRVRRARQRRTRPQRR